MRATIVLLALLGVGIVSYREFDAHRVGKAAAVLRVDQAYYRLGDSIRLELRNVSEAAVYADLCSTVLEQRRDLGWSLVKESAPRWCELVERAQLAPDSTTVHWLRLPAGLPEGHYRLKTQIEVGSERVGTGITSKPFRVAGRHPGLTMLAGDVWPWRSLPRRSGGILSLDLSISVVTDRSGG